MRGVTAIAQEITVRTASGAANDTDIAREAGEALQRAVDVPDSVKVAVQDHEITLSGAVKWQYQREAAGRAVRYTKGINAVRNSITIRPGAVAAGVKTAICAALVRNAQFEGNTSR